MTYENMRLELIDYLMALPYSKRRGNSQLSVRCVFCGDSNKHHDSTHLYIKINIEREEPILYNCFKCNSSGVMKPSVLREFDIRDLKLASTVNKYNKETTIKTNKRLGILTNNFKVDIPFYSHIDDTQIKKKEYIEKRLGITLSSRDLVDLKIVLSLTDLMLMNKIDTPIDKSTLESLDKYYVGFLSAKCEFVIFRNITDKGYRYYKHSLFNVIDGSRKFYTIPNTIDLLTTDTIYLNLAEGTFDILGIYYHLKKKNLYNNIFTAVCGSGYLSVIKYYIQLGIFGSNVILNIYSDTEVHINTYKKLSRNIGMWFKEVRVYYNSKSKDCGVRKDEILISKGIKV